MSNRQSYRLWVEGGSVHVYSGNGDNAADDEFLEVKVNAVTFFSFPGRGFGLDLCRDANCTGFLSFDIMYLGAHRDWMAKRQTMRKLEQLVITLQAILRCSTESYVK